MRFYIEKWADMNGDYFLLRLENTFDYLSNDGFTSETNRKVFSKEQFARDYCEDHSLSILNDVPFDMGIA